MELKFKARKTESNDEMSITYSCDCGCQPEARYKKGTSQSGHEHCCCGKVHFAGPHAEQELDAYLADRRKKGEDEGLGYDIKSGSIKAPWGDAIPVAYALPYAEADRRPSK